MLDTGAASFSTTGQGQAQAYIRDFGAEMIPIDEASGVTAKFGLGTTHSIGQLTVRTPFGEALFHVMDEDLPFLLCIQDMDRLGVYLNNITDQAVQSGGRTLPI